MDDTILEYVGSCHYISVRNETLPCKAWEYDRTYYESTIVTDARISSRFFILLGLSIICFIFIFEILLCLSLCSGTWCVTGGGWPQYRNHLIC